jgi:N6-L-threonylcarbamoyladenine synthase
MVLMKDHNRMKWIGGTLDDAAGECFDKCARLLGLPYPGGPAIAAKAEEWLQSPNSKFEIRNSKLTKFPRPMIREDSYDFSFSGLKTAVLREVTKEGSFDKLRTSALSMHEVRALAAEVQEAICDSLVGKLRKAVEHYKSKSVIVAGGVAANKRLKEKLEQEIGNKTSLFIPPPKLCTDNGAYIAAWAFYHYSPIPWQKIDVEPGLGIMGG